ncbi:GNAT family N-acetyltransferase [Catenulispora pinisilvae]|uniref:GNAT family N-acetyltransferase n=1 Tax=Catenulispora pinisilvae TaxID=2705253 RepID=UPI0018917026|nr:GNAT family N-acetyltransferase [Catenulispora pinisilvae]
MSEISIRESRAGDGVAGAEVWREMGSLFTATNPDTFHVPASEGLAEWIEEIHTHKRAADDNLLLVAEVDGVVAGTLGATLHEPIEGAYRELQTDFGRRRLHIDSLGVLGAYRRDGVGTALMQAAEAWGRERGAEVVLLETETNNALSVPFYEKRMGYSAREFVFRKELGADPA